LKYLHGHSSKSDILLFSSSSEKRGSVKIGHDGGRKDILKPKGALMMMISFKIDAYEKNILKNLLKRFFLFFFC
jgi:hypothetical protein